MFRIVPVTNATDPGGGVRGEPLHVSLSASSSSSSDDGGGSDAGKILTVGRSGCDVNFSDDPLFFILRLVKLPETSTSTSRGSDASSARNFMEPRDDEEWAACRAASDGMIVVAENHATSGGTIIDGGKETGNKKVITLYVEGYGKEFDGDVFPISFYSSDPLADLKYTIQEKIGIPDELQRIYVAGRDLDDMPGWRTLEECSIKNRMKILVAFRSSPPSQGRKDTPEYSPKSSQRRHYIHPDNKNQRFIISSLSLPSENDVYGAAKDQGPLVAASRPTIDELPSVNICVAPKLKSIAPILSYHSSSYIEITRIPVNLCPDRTGSLLTNPRVGYGISDSAIGLNSTPYHPYLARTHLLASNEPNKASIKSLSAWCLNVPIVTSDYVLKGLAHRLEGSKPLPHTAAYLRDDSHGIGYSDAFQKEEQGVGPCHGRRDPLKGFLFVSLVPSETEGLVLAAGATVFRAYMISDDIFFSGAWLDRLETASTSPLLASGNKKTRLFSARTGGVVVQLDSSGHKLFKRKEFLCQRNVRVILTSVIIAAINKMEGRLVDCKGAELVGRKDMPSASFRLGWLPKISFDALPPDALRRILGDFIGGSTKDMISLIRLASCSKALQRCVYRESTFLWTTIDFTSVDEKFRNRLRDKALEALLRHTNTPPVTTELGLFSCRALKGSGLRPLLGSTVLQEIDLRFCCGQHDHRDPIPDAKTICCTIKSMPPFVPTNTQGGIKAIRMDSYDFPRSVFMSTIRRTSISLMTGLQRSLGYKLANTLNCADCRTSLYNCLTPSEEPESSEKDLVSSEARRSFCFRCKDAVCGRNDGCRKMQICADCNAQTCTSCAKEKPCRTCSEWSCCSGMLTCEKCGLVQCDSCNGDEIVTHECSVCRIVRCSSCQDFTYCDECSANFCQEHDSTQECAGCSETLCNECEVLDLCSVCQRSFCADCAQKRKCQECAVQCCVSCMGTNCTLCNEYLCLACIGNSDEPTLVTCAMCDNERCRLCSERCSSKDCTKALCKDCREDRAKCNTCDGFFCNECITNCSTMGCDTAFCDTCLQKESCESDALCGSCSGISCPDSCCGSLTCCACMKGEKAPSCSECERFFSCRDSGCTHGRFRLFCLACEVSYCNQDHCRESHMLVCCDPGNEQNEVVWHDMINKQINRRMKRIYRRRGAFLDDRSMHLLSKYSLEELKTLPFAEKLAHAEKVYAAVEERHGSLDIVDIGTSYVQPRITRSFGVEAFN